MGLHGRSVDRGLLPIFRAALVQSRRPPRRGSLNAFHPFQSRPSSPHNWMVRVLFVRNSGFEKKAFQTT